MALRTSSLLAALGQDGGLEVVLYLLKHPQGSNVKALAKDAGLSQPTVSRRLAELESAGLVAHERRGHPFQLRESARVGSLIVMASELSEELLALDSEAERALQYEVRECT